MFSDHREVHTELFNPFLGLRTSTQVPLIRTLTNRMEDTDFHGFFAVFKTDYQPYLFLGYVL